jgi:metallophosphoesterase (TIGR00282 family)
MPSKISVVNCLFIADILGRPGRQMVSDMLPSLRQKHEIDLCVANCENASGGKGVTVKVANELLTYGVDVLTSGNHVWTHQEILPYLESHPYILRPANYPPGARGSGFGVFLAGHGCRIGVLNLQGRVFMQELDCPFRVAQEAIQVLRRETHIILVDFHAEATSEKMAMGWYLDGKVSAVLGTHTHVQTADERILPGGTAYITDVGMTGPHDSVIGIDTDIVLTRFLTQMPAKFEPATANVKLCGVIVSIDSESGRAVRIQRLMLDRHHPEGY